MIKEKLRKERFWMAGILSLICFTLPMYVCATKPNAAFIEEDVDGSQSEGYDTSIERYQVSDIGQAILQFEASKENMDSLHLKMEYDDIETSFDATVGIQDKDGNILGQQTLGLDKNGTTTFKIDFSSQSTSENEVYDIVITTAGMGDSEFVLSFQPTILVGYEIPVYMAFLKWMCALYAVLIVLYMIYCLQAIRKGYIYEDRGTAWGLCQLAMLLLTVVVFVRQYEYGFWDLYIIAMQFILPVLMLVFNFIWMLQMRKDRMSLPKIYIVLGLVVGLVFDFVIPIGVTPDDQQHIYSSYYVASVLMGKQGKNTWVQCRETEKDYEITSVLSREHSNVYYASAFASVGDNDQYVDAVYSTDNLYNPHWTATIPALGIVLARILHMNAFWTLMMGRLFNTVFFVLAMAYAIKVIPVGKKVLFAVAFLPMVQQQVNSYSHDNLILSASMLLFAIGICWCSEKRKLRICDVILYLIAVFVVCRVKGGTYAVFALIPILFNRRDMAYRKLLKKYRGWIVLGCIGLVCLMFWNQITGLFIPNTSRTVGGAENYLTWAGAYSYSLSDFLHSPKTLIFILVNTFLEKLDFYFSGMISSHMGWIQFSLPTYVLAMNLLLVLWAICAENEEGSRLFGKREMIWGSLTALVTFAFCAAGLLLDYTPNTSMLIEGIQGRYFLPGVILICLVCTGLKGIHVENNRKKILPVAVAFIMFVNYYSIINCFTM